MTKYSTFEELESELAELDTKIASLYEEHGDILLSKEELSDAREEIESLI